MGFCLSQSLDLPSHRRRRRRLQQVKLFPVSSSSSTSRVSASDGLDDDQS